MSKRALPAPEPTSAYLFRTSLEYALYVLDHRAIPCITDGLKSSQRIALYLARSLNERVRTAAFAGKMIESELYLHGNKPAEDLLSRLAAPYLNAYPLLKGEGAFGTRAKPAKFGAARYTHVRKSAFADKVLYADPDIIQMMENHDGSRMMPTTFLPLIPLILLNGISGIAIGWSTRILPRSYADICAATLEYLRTGKITNRLTPKYENYNVKVTKGDEPGKYVVTGKFERPDKNHIRITEIPLETHQEVITLEAFRETLINYENWGLIRDFTDRSKDHIDIEIELAQPGESVREVRTSKDGKEKEKVYEVPEWTDDAIYEWFGLRYVLTERIVVLGAPDDPGVRQYETAQDVVKKFVDWRLGWYQVRYERLAKLALDEELFHRCVMAAYDAKVPNVISVLANKAALKDELTKAIKKAKLELREDIVEKLATLPGYRWTKEGRKEAEESAKAAAKTASEHAVIAKSPTKQKRVYEAELEQIASIR